MFQHILVPTDFSEESKRAFEIAKSIISPDSGTITLLHVIEIIADTTFEEFESFYLQLETRAEKHLDEMAPSEKNETFTIQKKVLYGNRVREIVAFALDHQVDLIILNSHKINMQDPGKGWGTISYKVGIASQCPVMLVK
ncbi:MAG: universal stress protein [Proteobacteria bacterium]|nr:universal stress protein [Desulfobacteraceae bacterium]MBU4001256.1 universal stress protein [Pseudomonadota bacterium]MBU4053523.1 universal stress protein [Pseudomonadota bacterium]MBU4316247.1 universal stress protein [Pseudomonadota bacterium]MBU4471335.1 universal stress protein [Pseudomonadota bacterium]